MQADGTVKRKHSAVSSVSDADDLDTSKTETKSASDKSKENTGQKLSKSEKRD